MADRFRAATSELPQLLAQAQQQYADADWCDARSYLDQIHTLRDEIAMRANCEPVTQAEPMREAA